MAGEDCSAGFAILPILMIVVFLSILSRALRGAGGYYGGYSRGHGSYRRPGAYYALQYLDNRGGYYGSGYAGGYNQPYRPMSYPSYSPPQPAYREQPPAGIRPPYGAPGPSCYGPSGYPGYQSPPPPAYSTAAPQGYPASYPSAPSGPAPEVPKATCSYCGSLSPATERHCMLCGAPMK